MNLYRNAVPYPMKSRIGLFTPASPKPGKKKGESTTATYVDEIGRAHV